MRTAYFSSARSVGVVFRVSRIVMRPAGGSTNWRVRVAMPDKRCRKLSAVRSPASRRGRGLHVGNVPRPRTHRRRDTAMYVDLAIELKEHFERDVEAREHARRLGQERAARAPRLGTIASVVMSPAPRSSASARRTRSRYVARSSRGAA